MQCLECGKKEAKYDGLCEDCFLKKTKFTELPQYIDLTICPHCHAVKFGGHWEHVPLEDAVYMMVDRNLKFMHEYDSYRLRVEHGEIEGEFHVLATVDITYKDIHTRELHEVLFDLKYESCPRCNRYYGNYFEAILQLRGLREYEVSEVIEFLRERVEYYAQKNENLFITKSVERREGWDFYLSDKREARKISREIARKYGATVKESPQIAGRKDGQDIYRVTYSVRLPAYRTGDVVNVEGTYYLIEGINQNFIKGKDILSGKSKLIDSKRHRIYMLVERKNIKKMLVIYQDGENVQLLSEENRVIDARTPWHLEPGKYVNAIVVDGTVYVLP
ncbi:MAG: NMD protein affecting ribosome stability and mRNA decay [Euryarchaeota archaeon]|nr:NMD protein affecting ribosome stability and mRNA decay [Euryarchaeota archaeon]